LGRVGGVPKREGLFEKALRERLARPARMGKKNKKEKTTQGGLAQYGAHPKKTIVKL